MTLDPVAEAFAAEYAEHGNAARAARAIGLMSSPSQRGHDLLHRPGVIARVRELAGNNNGALPVRLADRVGSTKLAEFEAAVNRFIELCGPL